MTSRPADCYIIRLGPDTVWSWSTRTRIIQMGTRRADGGDAEVYAYTPPPAHPFIIITRITYITNPFVHYTRRRRIAFADPITVPLFKRVLLVTQKSVRFMQNHYVEYTTLFIPVASSISDSSVLFLPHPPLPLPSTVQVYTVSRYRYHALLRLTRVLA